MKTLTTIARIALVTTIVCFTSCNQMETPATRTYAQEIVMVNTDLTKSDSDIESARVNAYIVNGGERSLYFSDIFNSNGSIYRSNRVNYWPELEGGAVMSVQAVSPSNIEIVNDSFRYTVNRSASEDVKACSQNFDRAGAEMNLKLKSVMTKVNVNIRPENASNVEFEVESIVMENVALSGEYSFESGRMQPLEERGSIEIGELESKMYLVPQAAGDVKVVVNYKVYSNGYLVFEGTHEASESGTFRQGGEFSYNIILPVGARSIGFTGSVGTWN
ncbi:MAG: fimbrillin family protein [Bacteroidales bacterium]|nr:fimbrillin family protein [Bacteroidales bacterium]